MIEARRYCTCQYVTKIMAMYSYKTAGTHQYTSECTKALINTRYLLLLLASRCRLSAFIQRCTSSTRSTSEGPTRLYGIMLLFHVADPLLYSSFPDSSFPSLRLPLYSVLRPPYILTVLHGSFFFWCLVCWHYFRFPLFILGRCRFSFAFRLSRCLVWAIL